MTVDELIRWLEEDWGQDMAQFEEDWAQECAELQKESDEEDE